MHTKEFKERLRVAAAVMKHHDQEQVGEERFDLDFHILFHICSPSLKEVRTETQTGKGPQAELLTGLFPLACSASFPTEFRTASPGMAPPTVEKSCLEKAGKEKKHLLFICVAE